MPEISLPKGAAIRGIGEKFAANPVIGTGSMTVPITISPGCSGFGPQLSLSHDSDAGNGHFGLGCTPTLPSITRKTDKGLPKYLDSEESDVFLLSGTEYLVPVLIDQGSGNLELGKIEPRTVGNNTYNIKCYRPRIEGLFASIERWTNLADPGDTFWHSISKDNITTWYGKTAESRIADPPDTTRIFSWLICQSHDDKSNVIVYDYKAEDSDIVDLSLSSERNRSEKTDKLRSANRYLKRIRYGNHKPYLPKLAAESGWPGSPEEDQWFFEVVLDYGEHDTANPLPEETNKKWPVRNDLFSTYRTGFEVRNYRLFQRVLMFHHFPGEQGVEANCLVRSTDFNYFHENNPQNVKNPIYSFLQSVSQTSYKRKEGGGYLSKSRPLEFEYTQPIIDEMIREVDLESLENLLYGLDGSNYQWVGLDGEALSGILTEQADVWFYKRNHSANHQVIYADTTAKYTAAHFGALERVATKPNTMPTGSNRKVNPCEKN